MSLLISLAVVQIAAFHQGILPGPCRRSSVFLHVLLAFMQVALLVFQQLRP